MVANTKIKLTNDNYNCVLKPNFNIKLYDAEVQPICI